MYLGISKIQEARFLSMLILQFNRWRILHRGMGLVVVIAVLAALAAIALPNFLGISDDASVRAAQTAIVNATKECQATWARGKRGVVAADPGGIQYFNGHTAASPALIDVSEYKIYSFAPNAAAVGGYGLVPAPTNVEMQCFSAGPAKKDMIAQSSVLGKFPQFVVRANGKRECAGGNNVAFPDTWDIGCDTAAKTWE